MTESVDQQWPKGTTRVIAIGFASNALPAREVTQRLRRHVLFPRRIHPDDLRAKGYVWAVRFFVDPQSAAPGRTYVDLACRLLGVSAGVKIGWDDSADHVVREAQAPA